MRKLLLVISLLAFIACLVVGILLAQESLDSNALVNDTVALNRPVSPYQQNILLIHVDQLSRAQPDLVSVWGLILYFPEPKLIFQPIYPNPLDANFTPPELSMTANGTPTARFLRQMTDQTEINWDNYVIFDHQGLTLIAADLLPSNNLTIDDPSAGIIEVEKVYFSRLCQELFDRGETALFQIGWRNLIPTHWRSNLPLDETLLNWHKLVQSDTPPRCEVFGE